MLTELSEPLPSFMKALILTAEDDPASADITEVHPEGVDIAGIGLAPLAVEAMHTTSISPDECAGIVTEAVASCVVGCVLVEAATNAIAIELAS